MVGFCGSSSCECAVGRSKWHDGARLEDGRSCTDFENEEPAQEANDVGDTGLRWVSHSENTHVQC